MYVERNISLASRILCTLKSIRFFQWMIGEPPPHAINDAIPKVVVRRFGAREIAPQGQEVESASTS
jgi:hypothetical protein